MHYDKDFGVECRIARFHNIYGPYGTWKGGREKAPAAFCRKVRCPSQEHSCRATLSSLLSCPVLLLHQNGLCCIYLFVMHPVCVPMALHEPQAYKGN